MDEKSTPCHNLASIKPTDFLKIDKDMFDKYKKICIHIYIYL